MTEPSSIRVGVLFGGKSGEHEVSLNSARTVLQALDAAGYATAPIGITTAGKWLVSGDPLARLTAGDPNGDSPEGPAELRKAGTSGAMTAFVEVEERLPPLDIIFPVLHGPYGEDGTVQGLLEMAGIPYVGCGVLASAAGMDKVTSKLLYAAAGLPQVRYRALLRRDWVHSRAALLDSLEAELAYPMFAKPANLGSSVGISKARDRAQLAQAMDLACQFDRKILVEEGVSQARELEVSVLGNDAPEASVVGEVIPAHEFYDYEAKYLDKGSQLVIPADIPSLLQEQIQEVAKRAFQVLDGCGLARVDFLLDGNGRLYLNEVNTMPGFTRSSMYPKLWEASGVPLPRLVHRLVELGLERHADRQRNRTHR